ncbi:NTP transferase domain-containing protein, partial [Candidatus Peregrinibacteria bacterium]|nr:NTP transferase domain-containing protein [Candidatus Peregrinibacteria bacterium]
MKGVILAGGTGSRLYPLTKVTNKHLLPVYSKPMIYYPLFTLKSAGITNVMIVSGKGHAGDFLELLGSGSQFGMKISYEVQEEAGGIAQALSLCEDFINNEKAVVILGDNVFEDSIAQDVNDFKVQPRGAKVFLK